MSTAQPSLQPIQFKDVLLYSLLTALAYFLSAKLVFAFSLAESESIFAIWPPTGVALVFLLYKGRAVIPGVFLGALWLNTSLGSNFGIAASIAVGNTLGPVLIYWLMTRRGNYCVLESTRTLIWFVFYCLIGSIITSSAGTTVLYLNDLLAVQDRLLGWLVWLFGDLIGFLLITVLYISLNLDKRFLQNREESNLELGLMLVLMLVLSAVIFGSGYFFETKYPIEYLVLFPLMWVSIRFRPNIVILFLFLLSVLAMIGTALGYSSFSLEERRLSLILLQFFILTVMLVVLMLTAQKYQMLTALFEKEQLSINDYLTQIPNRRHMMTHLENELDLLNRYQRQFSVVMFDIDFFKKINDEFGHPKGDKVLVKLTGLVQSEIRKTDLFARMGGEEFIVILPETDKEHSMQMAEKLRLSIEAYDFGINKTVTCSFGVFACESGHDYRIKDILKEVDQHMYTAKHSGRNCVIG